MALLISCDAPPPPAPPQPSDYPLKLGLKWTYETPPGFTVVREVDRVDGPWLRMRFELSIFGEEFLWMRRDGGRVLGRGEGGEGLLLRFPMRAGDRWRVEVPGIDRTADCEVVGEETLDLPIGRLRAVKVKVIWGGVTDYEWYAPGYGLVQMQVTKGVTKIFRLTRFEESK